MIRLTNDVCIYAFSAANGPAVEVDDGATLLLSTGDCYSGQIRYSDVTPGMIDPGKANPATGPVFVKGAEPGDTLAVDILELSPASWGLTVSCPGMGFLGSSVATERTHVVEVGPDGIDLGSVTLPYRPMLGVIGVAPAEGSVPTVAPGRHGGNLDCILVRQGATVFLPVSVTGALFAAGDMHAAMGDGEISGTGIEVPGTALLQLRVVRDFPVTTPWVDTGDILAVICAGETLEAASREACHLAIGLLGERLGLDFEDAYMLAGSALRLRICQVVNPRYTVRAEIPKWVLGKSGAQREPGVKA